MVNDLREFISQLEKMHEVKLITGAHWNLEIGLISELQLSRPDQPALIFNEIQGYRPGFRVITNALNTEKRFALAHGLSSEARGIALVKELKKKLIQTFKPVSPTIVETALVEENVLYEPDIDIFKLPVPQWHSLDGGRYIGTGDVVILKDPESNWINLGTYRVQVQDKNKVTIHIVDGHHGDIIRKKYWNKGQSCPVAIVCGQDPLLFSVASSSLCPAGISDYDYIGWLKQQPLQVIPGKITDLLIPAGSEIVLEGEMLPPGSETEMEGPFGEWEGYFTGKAKPEPIIKVRCILHRDNPILMGEPPFVAPYYTSACRNITQAAGIWSELEQRLPGIQGVWCPNEMRGLIMTIVSIQQLYPGHAKQVAMAVAASSMNSLNRFTVVVDEDIDPSNIKDVLWAVGTRCEPQESIDIIGGFCGMLSDPRLSPEKKEKGELYYSKAIIDACRPYTWKDQFPLSIKSEHETIQKIYKKWSSILF